MALITNYAELKAEIADYLHRQDLTAQIIGFISLAENQISADLSDLQPFSVTGTFNTVAGTRTYVAPVSVINLQYATRTEPALIELPIQSPDELQTQSAYNIYQAPPSYIAYDGNSFILHPTPDGVYTINYESTSKLTPLSDTNTTNIFLTKFPDIYLYASLIKSTVYTRADIKTIQIYEKAYNDALDAARSYNWLGDAKLRIDQALQKPTFNFLTGD